MKKYLPLLVVLLVIGLAMGGLKVKTYVSTPPQIKTPSFEHYHLRAQVVIDGVGVDFSKDEVQRDYDGATCSAEVSEEPFDFHDNMDQFVHVHWDGMTGGQFLKYYGLNVIGGDDAKLGNDYSNSLFSPSTVDIYNDYIPEPSDTARYFVYVGDQNGYELKSWDDFVNQDLEDFFGKKSNLSRDKQTSLIEKTLLPKAYAQDSEKNEHLEGTDKSEEDLKRINNLIGNVVIFAQEIEPTTEQIAQRFSNLIPLHDSTCGG